MSEPVRVSVCSPEPVVRAGLTALLHRHELVTVPLVEDPQVVLYDVLALLRDGEAALTAALAPPGRAVVAVDHGTHPHLLARSLALGVAAYVPLSVSGPDLARAVVVAAGRPASPAALGGDAGLTEREVAVLSLVVRGYTNQQIADELFLSINSIKTYIRLAYRKIGATRRGQAVSWAVRHGFPLVGPQP